MAVLSCPRSRAAHAAPELAQLSHRKRVIELARAEPLDDDFVQLSLALTISTTATHGWIESVSDESASSMIPISEMRKFTERPLSQCLKTATLPLIGLPTVS
jgi:hypothetical protein